MSVTPHITTPRLQTVPAKGLFKISQRFVKCIKHLRATSYQYKTPSEIDTVQSYTCSEWKAFWHFPHGCCKLFPAENGKGRIIKYAVTHFIAISSSSTKGDRDKILPDWRWGCDCLEMRESSEWTNLNDPHPARVEYMEICMQSVIVGRDRASVHVCGTLRKRELDCDFNSTNCWPTLT